MRTMKLFFVLMGALAWKTWSPWTTVLKFAGREEILRRPSFPESGDPVSFSNASMSVQLDARADRFAAFDLKLDRTIGSAFGGMGMKSW